MIVPAVHLVVDVLDAVARSLAALSWAVSDLADRLEEAV